MKQVLLSMSLSNGDDMNVTAAEVLPPLTNSQVYSPLSSSTPFLMARERMSSSASMPNLSPCSSSSPFFFHTTSALARDTCTSKSDSSAPTRNRLSSSSLVNLGGSS